MILIHIENLSFSYRKQGRKSPLFADLTLELSEGGIYGLLGKNGAGKTSLLRLISGQLFPLGGSCRILGYDPSKREPELLSEMFFVPEEFYVPPVPGRTYRDVYAPFYPSFDEARFAALIDEFELDIEQRLSNLSYGQKKKFLLAFALATGCRLLILDEPTNGLDIPSKRQFRRSVAAAATDEQIIMISTHQVRDMENLIDPIIVLDEGRIVFFHDLDVVSRTFVVTSEVMQPTGEDVVYAEKHVGGYTALKTQRGAGSAVDLELLFNAVIEAPSRIESACLDTTIDGDMEVGNE